MVTKRSPSRLSEYKKEYKRAVGVIGRIGRIGRIGPSHSIN